MVKSIFSYNSKKTPFDLLKLSWQSLKDNYRSLFFLYSLNILTILMFLFIIILFFSQVYSIDINILYTGLLNDPEFLQKLDLTSVNLPFFVSISLLLLLIIIKLSLVFEIAGVLIIDKKYSTPTAIKKSFKYIPQLIIAIFLMFLMVLPSLYLSVVPALIISFFLVFVIYEIIISNQGALSAIRESILMVRNNFLDVFIKISVWVLLSLSILAASYYYSENFGTFGEIISLILQFVLKVLSTAYMISYYKDLQSLVPRTDKVKDIP